MSIRSRLARLDDLVFAGERAVVAFSLLTMSIVVVLDVVWRTAHSLEGAHAYGFAAGIFALTMIGAFTARLSKATPLKRLAYGLAAYALMAAACVAIYLAPNGFGWSQTVAMVLLLWVGMIGTSMATKEGRHIAVDAVKRVLPDHLKRPFEIAACSVTVAFSSFLAVLGVIYCSQNWLDWVASEYRSHVFESIAIPYWVATLPIPIGFGLTAARFVAVAVHGSREVDVLTSVGGADLEAKP
jgi:C4-dicarboxylate transporter DctQ subunit